MIKRIIKLENVGRFEKLRSSSGNDGEFSKVNVIYALNACGKTTLCDVLRSLDTQNSSYVIGRKRIGGEAEPLIDLLSDNNQHLVFNNGQWNCPLDGSHILVFDQRFVKDNVIVGGQIGVEQKRNVYSLALGPRAIELNRAVQKAGDELTRATEAVSRCASVLSALIPAGQQIDTFRTLEKVDDVDVKILGLKARIAADKNKMSKADQIRKHGLMQKIAMPSIAKSDLESVLSTTLDDAALTAEGKIKEHLALCSDPKKLSVDWIKQGYEAQTGTLCPYCGQVMSHVDLFTTYKVFFSGALKQQENRRSGVRSAFQSCMGDKAQIELVNVAKQNSGDVSWWKDACGLSIALPSFDVEAIKGIYSRVLRVALAAIARKQSNLTIAVPLLESEIVALDSLGSMQSCITAYNDAIDVANAQIKEFQRSIATINIDDSTKELSLLELQKKRYEKSVVSAYQEYDSALLAKQAAQDAKTQANDALKEESKSIFDSFGDKINEILGVFGVNFTVGNDGVNLRGGVASGQLSIKISANGQSAQVDCSSGAADDPSRLSLSNSLSGGDCSALALAFFLAKLETDSNLASAIVVIDDPYHDQDRSRQSQTISLLKRKANACSQFFLLSHNIEFAQMFMSDKGIARNEIRAFEIPQMGSAIELKHGELPQLPSKSYETDYMELAGYVDNPDLYHDKLKEVVGRIRPLLETYLHYKYPLNFGEKVWLGDMISCIKNAQIHDVMAPCKCLVTDLEDVNAYTQRFHHRVTGVSADVPDPIELKTYVNLALKIVHHA